MNSKMKYGVVAALLCGFISPALASTKVLTTPLVNETALAYNNTYSLNLSTMGTTIDKISFQALYTSATIAAATFTDGTQSTATFTITDYTKLSTATASDYLTVLTTKSLSGSSIAINGLPLREGIEWNNDVLYSSWTAISIMRALNNWGGVLASTAGTGVVYTTATAPGAYGNNISLVSYTSSITVNSAKFTGGRDNAEISINGVGLIANTDFYPNTSAAVTAKALSDAIMAKTSLSGVVVSTWASGVVYTTSSLVGVASKYAITSSTQAALTIAPYTSSSTVTGFASGNMAGGTNSGFVINTPTITITSHGFTKALPVLYTGTPAIGGLTTTTTYYAYPLDTNTFKLSNTSTGAIAGVGFQTITSSSAQTTARTYTLSPLAISGTPSFKFQTSNDGSNWTDYATNICGVTVSSVTMTSYVYGGTSTQWDMGPINFGWIRANVVAPLTGAIRLLITPNATSVK